MSNDVTMPHPQPLRILVRGVNWVGDAVMTTPALLRLREHFPGAHIGLLAPQKLAGLWENYPALNETVCFSPGENVWSVARRLRRGRYDIGLVLPNSPRSALEVWLAGIPRRLAYARPWRNWSLTEAIPSRVDAVKMPKLTAARVRQLQTESRQGEPATPRRPVPASAHQVNDYLHLAAVLGADPAPLPPQLFVTNREIESVVQKFGLADAASAVRPILALNPGAEYGSAKRWPAERFAAAAMQVQKRTGCACLILGGPKDVPLADRILSAFEPPNAGVRNLAGRTSLRELCAILKLSRVLLTNDTGPMHIAAALGTSVVVPFGSTSPELTGPGLTGDSRHRLLQSGVPCSPCFLRECPAEFRCMNQITVESVAEAVLELFASHLSIGTYPTSRDG